MTTMAITRPRSQPCSRPRAAAPRARSSPSSSRTGYTRVRDLFDEFATCFKDADHVIVAPLYTAGESPIPGIDHRALAERIRAHRAIARSRPSTIRATSLPAIKRQGRPGDIVVCLGAGNSTEWAHALPEWLGEAPKRTGSVG